MVTVTVHRDGLPVPLLAMVRAMVVAAFDGDFADEDWDHTCGGVRVLAMDGEVPVGHAAVVARVLDVADRQIRSGYVEGVAAARPGAGIGSLVMQAVGDLVRADHEMGALSTGRHSFYRRLGWERWQGPTYVREPDEAGGLRRTPDEDDGVMVLRHGPSTDIDLTAPITCQARPGDDW